MSKSAVTIILGFLVVFAAGGVVGKALTRTGGPHGPGEAGEGARPQAVGEEGRNKPDHHDGAGRGGFLIKELKLTPEQAEQMKQIWQAAMPAPEKIGERRQALQKERDEAIQALLSEEQKAKFEQINKNYQHQQEELRRERTQAFEAAVAETRKILTDEQRQKYDEFRKRWDAERERGGPGGERRRGGPPPFGMEGGPPPSSAPSAWRGGGNGPATRPAMPQ